MFAHQEFVLDNYITAVSPDPGVVVKCLESLEKHQGLVFFL
jgi:hypothetical protein